MQEDFAYCTTSTAAERMFENSVLKTLVSGVGTVLDAWQSGTFIVHACARHVRVLGLAYRSGLPCSL